MTVVQSCARCRTVLIPGQQGCVRCGLTAAEPTRECPACRRPTAVDAQFCPACGEQLRQRSPMSAADPATDLVPGTDPATAPASGTDPAAPLAAAPAVFATVRKPRRWVYLLTGVALAVLLTGIAGLYAVQSILYTPGRVVTGYFAALSERDTAAARSFLEEPRSESPNDPGELPLIPMTASYQPPSEVVVTSIEELNEVELAGSPAAANSDDWRSATVTYLLGDRTHREKLYLHRQERKEKGVFRGWLIYGGINRMAAYVGRDGLGVLINGQAVPTREGYARARVFPGVHEVRLADDPLFEAEPEAAEVGLLKPHAVPLMPTLRESARDEVESQVKAYLDECAKSTDLSPDGCPFSWIEIGTSKKVEWTIDAYPKLSFSVGDGEVAVRGLLGRVTVAWTGYGGVKHESDLLFHVTGQAAVIDGKVTFRSD
ncbi:zinc ribbon domain-containing protein [Salinispora arenicola]|uniref:zinc ribbon domain-containing protein n=1 Tax=Salinispora arenicola TaxID=168697 RepID=UPI000364F2D8|nr:zinc ribbon domain-containing protein [Salinispora arenicola]